MTDPKTTARKPFKMEVSQEWCERMAQLEEGEISAGIMHPEATFLREFTQECPLPPRAGDRVHHDPTGENWVLGRVDDGYVYPFGWPRSRARAGDCSVTQRCTDDEHQEAVAAYSRSGGF